VIAVVAEDIAEVEAHDTSWDFRQATDPCTPADLRRSPGRRGLEGPRDD
jgi:hypothetical protein